MKLTGKVVIVTGGANGIGKALCERFHREGAKKVIVADLDKSKAEITAAAIEGDAFSLDVRNEEQIAAMVKEVEKRYGTVDLFCSNAGILAEAPEDEGFAGMATSTSNDVWQAMWEIHVMAHVFAARACLPGMIQRGGGYFLNVASSAGLLQLFGAPAYTTSKHASVGFAEALAITHGDDGIKVSALCPEVVATALTNDGQGVEELGMGEVISPENVAEAVIRGLDKEDFLILPHKHVESKFQRKASDYTRWIGQMRIIRSTIIERVRSIAT